MRGVYLEDFKDTDDLIVKKIPVPNQLIIPLLQHLGEKSEAIVKIGDKVKKYQLIAKKSSEISANIHSPVDGTITDIGLYPHPTGIDRRAIVIKPNEDQKKIADNIKSSKYNKTQPLIDYEKYIKKTGNLNDKKLIQKIRDAGIVGLGGAMFPTANKIGNAINLKSNTLIVNACECEPYITSDSRLIQEEAEQIILGIIIIAKVLKIKKIYFGIEDNKTLAIKELKEMITNLSVNKKLSKDDKKIINNIKIKKLKTIYPTGAEKVLINLITGIEVPQGKLPLETGILVQNVSTIHAIYDAIVEEKPVISRIVTVTGKVKNPGNYKALIGTTIHDLINTAGGLHKNTDMLIYGGPMMGLSFAHQSASVIKGNNCILAINDNIPKSEECIRCGKCIDVCPMSLAPKIIATYVKNSKIDKAIKTHAKNCIECGCCSYICPSKIDLVPLIKTAKKYNK